MLWLLHGNLGVPADWDDISDRLRAKGIDSRALNLWKYRECCASSLTQMGSILCAEIRAHDKHPVICGYSLGGRLAMHAVLAEPTLWAGAIFISAHPGMESEKEKSARRERDATWAVRCLHDPWDDFLAQWNAQPVFAGAEAPDRSRLKLRRKSIACAFIDWSVGTQQDLAKQLAASPVPQLWISGARDARFTALLDRVCPPKISAVIPDAGHRLPAEAPEALAERIESFYHHHAGRPSSHA